jgi:hypothetical protein
MGSEGQYNQLNPSSNSIQNPVDTALAGNGTISGICAKCKDLLHCRKNQRKGAHEPIFKHHAYAFLQSTSRYCCQICALICAQIQDEDINVWGREHLEKTLTCLIYRDYYWNIAFYLGDLEIRVASISLVAIRGTFSLQVTLLIS